MRATKLAFNSSKLVVETPKVPNLLKVSNKNVQLSKCPNIFFSGTSVANFEHIFAFRVKHLTVTYAYFFYNRMNLQASKDCIKSCMVSIQSLYSSFHQKIKSINTMQSLQLRPQYVDYLRKTLPGNRL